MVAISASISSSGGSTVRNSRSPAAVGDTLRFGAGQKPDAEPHLQLADGLAQCGLRDAQFGGRFREASLASHGHQGTQIVQFPRCIYQLRLWAFADFSA
jgi:hypothetical protein